MILTLLLSTILLGNPSWDHASVSAYAVNTKTGEVVMDENSDKSLMPASCVKAIDNSSASADLQAVRDAKVSKNSIWNTDGTIDSERILAWKSSASVVEEIHAWL